MACLLCLPLELEEDELDELDDEFAGVDEGAEEEEPGCCAG